MCKGEKILRAASDLSGSFQFLSSSFLAFITPRIASNYFLNNRVSRALKHLLSIMSSKLVSLQFWCTFLCLFALVQPKIDSQMEC
jgi:hypothetical protein